MLDQLKTLGYTPDEAARAINDALDRLDASAPGSSAAPAAPAHYDPAAQYRGGPPAAAPQQLAPAPAPARAPLPNQPVTQEDLVRMQQQLTAETQRREEHRYCKQALQYDGPTSEIAEPWVEKKRAELQASGQVATTQQLYGAFDQWRRSVQGTAMASPGGQPSPAAPGPPGAAPTYATAPTYAAPAPAPPPPAPGYGTPGVVAPTLPAGHQGQPQYTLDVAAQAREAARMGGTPGAGGGGAAAPRQLPADQEFEQLGVTAPHSQEFLDRVDDREVQRAIAMEGQIPGNM
jgi:hypothetical protein